MKILDTNAVLRFLLGDNAEQKKIVLAELECNKCLVTIEVVAEAVYVLNKVYSAKRNEIKDYIEQVAAIDENIISNKAIVFYALDVFSKTSLDFIDCLLVGYQQIEGYEIFTFDKKLRNLLNSL
jgi:predicted nucleic-acid-binding protein